jgi:hypothetical protein
MLVLFIFCGSAMFLYRPFIRPDQYADVGIGCLGLDGGFNLNEGPLPAFNAANGLSWADPMIRTIDYAAASGIDLHAGFRSLNFSYGAPRANIEFNLNGPILAATFRF